MPIKIFLVELRRTWVTCSALFLLCFLSGAVFLTSINLSKYLASLFQEVNVGVDMIILPKAITPESMQKSLIKGQPEALMPVSLFETLQNQAVSETQRKSLNEPPVQLLAIVPFKNEQGLAAVAKIGDVSMIRNKDKTSWAPFEFKELDAVKQQLTPKNLYYTDEWKDKTIFGILVNAEPEVLARLKLLIDRRTIAQAYILTPGHSDTHQKLEKLKSGLLYLTEVIVFSILIGIIISFQKLHVQRDIIFRCLKELGHKRNLEIKFYLLQIGFLIVLPLILGMSLAYATFPLIQNLV